MQPFQSTKGPLGDTLAADSNFFFRPGQIFDVSVFEDPKANNEPGPGIVETEKLKLLGKGTVRLGEGRFVDSVQMNIDPHEMKGMRNSSLGRRYLIRLAKSWSKLAAI